MFAVGRMYADAVGVEQNFKFAMRFFKKAADYDNLDAMSSLGMMYANGLSVKQDMNKAIKFFQKAATGGLARAQYNLGVIYRDGRGVERSLKTAIKYFLQAARNNDAPAMSALGYAYSIGEGLEKDLQKAVDWFTKSAEQGYPVAQFNLGLAYRDGLMGLKPNMREALSWLTGAAEQGHANAQCSLGVAYADGRGVERDYEQARIWYTKAAEQGYINAQYNLGVMYENGQGVDTDYALAFNWYKQCVERGLPNAQYRLGYLYENGLGVNVNIEEAIKWYQYAADAGFEPAIILLDEVANGKELGSASNNDNFDEKGVNESDIQPPKPAFMMYHDSIVDIINSGESDNVFDKCNIDDEDQITVDNIQRGMMEILNADATIYAYIQQAYVLTTKHVKNEALEHQNPKKSSSIIINNGLSKSNFMLFLTILKKLFQYSNLYDLIDSDKSGKIEFEEFEILLSKLKVIGFQTKDSARDNFDLIDQDDNGSITFDEFCIWAIDNDIHSPIDNDDENITNLEVTFIELVLNIPGIDTLDDLNKRHELFIQVDNDFSQSITFNEIFTVIAPLCDLPDHVQNKNNTTASYNCAYVLKEAYDKIRQYSIRLPEEGDFNGLNYLEFNYFLTYIKEYLSYSHVLYLFNKSHMDTIHYDEFMTMYPKIEKYCTIKHKLTANELFTKIDKDHDKLITFNDLIYYLSLNKWNILRIKHKKFIKEKMLNKRQQKEIYSLFENILENKLPIERNKNDLKKEESYLLLLKKLLKIILIILVLMNFLMV